MTDISELAQKRNAAISQLRVTFEPGQINQREVYALTYAVDVLNDLMDALLSSDHTNRLTRERSDAWELKAILKFQECSYMEARVFKLRERIAELETRTVKLPQRYDIEEMSRNPFGYHRCLKPDNQGDYVKIDDVIATLTAAGIKVEAEE